MHYYEKLPIFPLQTVLFPGMSLPLHIFEPRYRLMVAHCIKRRAPFGVVLIPGIDETSIDDEPVASICRLGSTARIVRSDSLVDGRFFIDVRGETRFEIEEVFNDREYLTARVRPVAEPDIPANFHHEVIGEVASLFREYLAAAMVGTSRRISALQLPDEPSALSYAVAAALDVSADEKQRLLEAPTITERFDLEIQMLRDARHARSGRTAPIYDVEPPAPEMPRIAARGGATIRPLDYSVVRSMISRN